MNGQKYTHHPFHIRLWKRTTFIYKTLARLGEGKEKFVRAICEVTIIQLSNIPQNTNHGAWREWLGRRGGSGHTVSSSAERGIMCDKILSPDTLNVDMGDFVWNNTASCKCRIWNEVQLISVCCPALHFWLVINKIFWSWNWRAPIWWAVCPWLCVGCDSSVLTQYKVSIKPGPVQCLAPVLLCH